MTGNKISKQEMIENNYGLVHACANKFRGRGAEYDDLFQAGCIGLIKAADKLSALIKCINEKDVGNRDFESAEQTIRKSIEKSEFQSVKYFMDNILPCYSMTLDELSEVENEN